ncbi:MAG: hypothetical protein ACRD3O_10845 [Terriglobia bacterium]
MKTLTEMGWRGTKDRLLLAYAQESFDVFVTIDSKLERQNDLTRMKLAIVIAHVPSNEITAYESVFPALLEAVTSAKPGSVIHVGAGP